MSSTESHITKYFFGYYTYHGIRMSAAWAEDNGLPVGVPILYTQRHEITERQWETSTIASLKAQYPPEPE